MLAIELQALIDVEFDVSVTGFSLAEVDLTLDRAREASATAADGADVVPALPTNATTCSGDLWQLGRHRLLCGDAQQPSDVRRLVGAERVDLVFTDPPYNVPVHGHVGGLGRTRHREFAFASGEMSEGEFTDFLRTTLGNAAAVTKDSSIAFVCMDWRHIGELMSAADTDAIYCDTIITRWQNYTGKHAILAGGGRSYQEVAAERLGPVEVPTAAAPTKRTLARTRRRS